MKCIKKTHFYKLNIFLFIKWQKEEENRQKKRKGYFYEEQEQAVKDYIRADNEEEKNKIFNTILLPAFTKMIESIIRRYNLYSLEEEQEYKRDEAFRQDIC